MTVGEELLSGQTVDANAAWLGRELGALGVRVVRRATVGDVDADIRDAVGRALEQAELVLVTGGLGPTSDDRTRPAVAGLLGRPLAEDPELLDRLRERFRAHGVDPMPESNRTQAQVPGGAEALPNPRGTAPGLLVPAGEGRVVVLLPGVPGEMRGIAAEQLFPRLQEHWRGRLRPLRHRVLHTTGIAESELAARLEGRLPGDGDPVEVAFLPDVRGVDLRLSVRASSDAEAREALDRVEAAVRSVVDPFRYRAEETGDLVEAVLDALVARGKRLAVAESCTGGLVAKRLTDRSGASAAFEGGAVTYADAAKTALLGVPAEVLRTHGAVSEAVARAMATGVAARFGTDCGIGVTGVAGPGGGSEAKPVGTVWYAASVDGRTRVRRSRFPGDREAVRERSAQAALALLLRLLEGRADDAADGRVT